MESGAVRKIIATCKSRSDLWTQKIEEQSPGNYEGDTPSDGVTRESIHYISQNLDRDDGYRQSPSPKASSEPPGTGNHENCPEQQKGNPDGLSEARELRIRRRIHDPHAVQNGAPPNQRGPSDKSHGCREKQEDTHGDYSGVRFHLNGHLEPRSETDPEAVDYTPEETQAITARKAHWNGRASWFGDLVHRDCPAYSTGEFKKYDEGLELTVSGIVDSRAKRFFIYLFALFSIAPLALARQNSAKNSGSWSGTLVSSACNADEAFAEVPECTKNLPGAKLSLLDDTDRVMYGLEPQESVTAHLGDSVTVRGTLDAGTIRVASIELMSIGLAVGQKAPAFSVHDQFGRVQSLDTLKGPNGTVLLFFRSADW